MQGESRQQEKPADSERARTGGGSGGDENPPGIDDPIIGGLLKRLPKTGDVWPEADRKLWLQLLEGSFKLIYQDAPAEPPSASDDGVRRSKYA